MTDELFRVVEEHLWNSHRMALAGVPDCAALVDEVVTYPDRCNCGVKDADAALSDIKGEVEGLTKENEQYRVAFDVLERAGIAEVLVAALSTPTEETP